ncbi:LysR family transcriptional regulator [Mycobacterium sp. CBMA293]|uniref:LysR family transcriptional regulator n=1 Tax=unclassified Mycolicibacterium TaxID=2636767 RepID=UPI0012DC5FDA|nr:MULTISPECIES: LysR family transcriptional regulator [unclassified Mycolicibacterium]MUL45606.1 LysR family transcriptional regulator [Mycolicibacterium sp. CBMA 360]MUL60276.1 LysR family transcriptional regulator [Mycolicibacterium sp. CBMA 335]MUL71512.1 LysR family transcriptional regulator [Mycolicibacterium sp. CBMA 311]MUL73063.1 LysR family transcriptional regulator [Mycolicibacterium sp. CBMA 311]MUL95962.1 LysR family transcriptional regulator [Mycolicibacterium sp. CBMA 230]
MTRPYPDLRRLQHFLAVADEGGFTRAADQLHLSQQALSSSIRQLEKELGATLFERDGRRVTLTPAGRQLLTDARSLLAAAHTVVDHVQRAASAARENYVVGHTPALDSIEAYGLLEPVIEAFDDVSFTFRQMFPDQLSAALLDGSIQLGMRRGVVPDPDLATAVLGYHPVRVALLSDHPLARRDAIDLTDLADERIALWGPPGASYYSDLLLGACRRAGFEPDYVISRVQGAATVAAPLTTGGAAFVTQPTGAVMDGRVTVVDLQPPLLVPVQAMWQRHTRSPIRDLLLAQLR